VGCRVPGYVRPTGSTAKEMLEIPSYQHDSSPSPTCGSTPSLSFPPNNYMKVLLPTPVLPIRIRTETGFIAPETSASGW